MKVTGQGEVFLADRAQDIHLIYLENDKITVNGPNLLAFDAGIDWDIERVKGVSGMIGGGLYNTALKGTGWVAILSDGPPVLLNVAQAPTFADAAGRDHVVVGRDRPRSRPTSRHEEPDRQGLGRAFQMAFGGQGWVLVQPSEGQHQGRCRPAAAAAAPAGCSAASCGS